MEQVRDPVCGRMIDPDTARAKMTDGANDVYFCSHECRRVFQAERHEPPYTVTRHMIAPKFGSAVSGGLEDEPGPERHDK